MMSSLLLLEEDPKMEKIVDNNNSLNPAVDWNNLE